MENKIIETTPKMKELGFKLLQNNEKAIIFLNEETSTLVSIKNEKVCVSEYGIFDGEESILPEFASEELMVALLEQLKAIKEIQK